MIFIYCIVFLFPIVIATVNKAGGVLYVFLFLISLFSWKVWNELEGWEKKTLVGFVVFFLLVSLSLFNSDDTSKAIKKLGRFVHLPLLLPMVLLIRRHKLELGRFILISLMLASLVMFGQACYEIFALNKPRAVGGYHMIVFGDIAILIAMLIVSALIVLIKEWRLRLLAILAVGLALYASIASGSRGAWVFLPVFLVWIVWAFRSELGKRRIAVIFSLIVLLFSVLININQVKTRIDVAIAEYNSYWDRSTSGTSIGARLSMWRDSITIWQAHPIVGTGVGDFLGDSIRLYEQGESHLKHTFSHGHSIYFDMLATTGIIGFVAMLAFVFWFPYRMFSAHWHKETDNHLRFYALAGMTTVLAFAVFGLTESWLSRNPFVRTYLMFILIFMTSIAVRKDKLKQVES